MPPSTTDRRPAIWPWLVMPLVTLALYYGLDRLNRQNERDAFGRGAPQTAIDSSGDSDSR